VHTKFGTEVKVRGEKSKKRPTPSRTEGMGHPQDRKAFTSVARRGWPPAVLFLDRSLIELAYHCVLWRWCNHA